MSKTLLVTALVVLAFAWTSANADVFPKYKPSSRSPEPLDIRTNEYGFSQSAPNALRVGDKLPDFKVLSPNEEVIDSAEIRAEGPVVVVFYRGHW